MLESYQNPARNDIRILQGAAFSWLGNYYAEVAQDAARAEKCYLRALSIDPSQQEAGAQSRIG